MKTLVLAEKPSVGRDLAGVLNCGRGGKGYLEGKTYIVTWAMGHLVELADPSAYDVKYKSWRLEDLPMLPDKMKFRVIKKTSGQFNLIKRLLKRDDVGSVVIATDAGREGELVARLILKLAGWKGPFKRLWISSQTDQAIKDGFASLKDGRDYDNLYRSALARAEADWIVGLNITRALSCRYDVRLSSGRVQTPALNLIAEREESIRNFESRPYWKVFADFGGFTAVWKDSSGNSRIYAEDRAVSLSRKVSSSSGGTVVSLTRKKKKTPPPLAYDLTALQRDANSRLGFSAKKTLSTLQVLYERHKIATYPRTDSRYITEDIVPTLKARLKALSGTRYGHVAGELVKKPVNPGKRFVDNSKVSDHHAIIPTEQPVIPERLSPDELKLMNLIIERFLVVLHPSSVKEVSVMTVEASGERFHARGVRIVEKGWLVAGSASDSGEDESEDPVSTSPFPAEGSVLAVENVSVREERTRPPSRYTEGTLLGVMENPSGHLKDKSLRESISSGGIGTPATRADIIEKIISNNYVERNGKDLLPTSRGLELLTLVPEELKTVDLTALWEQRLAGIAAGKEKPGPFLKEIRIKTRRFVDEIKQSKKEYSPSGSGEKKCPMCGKPMFTGKDKRGRKILVCHSLSCGYSESPDSHQGGSMKMGRREKAISRKLISRYSDKSSGTATFADLIRAAEERKKGGSGK